MRIFIFLTILVFVPSISFSAEFKACKSSGGSTSSVRVTDDKQLVSKTTIDQADPSLLWDVNIVDEYLVVKEYSDPNSGIAFESNTTSYHIISNDKQAIYGIQKPNEYGRESSGQIIFIDIASKVIFASVYERANMSVSNPSNVALNHVFICGK